MANPTYIEGFETWNQPRDSPEDVPPAQSRPVQLDLRSQAGFHTGRRL